MPEQRPHLTASFLEEGKKLDTGRVTTGFWRVLGVSNPPIVDRFARYPPIWPSKILSACLHFLENKMILHKGSGAKSGKNWQMYSDFFPAQ